MKSPLILAVVLLVPAVSFAQKDSVNDKRHKYVDASKKDVGAFCAEARSWRIIESDTLAGLSKDKSADADMGNWSDVEKGKVRRALGKVKGYCRNVGEGLDTLAQKEAALDKVDEDTWDKVDNEIVGLLQAYQGHDAFGRQKASDSYKEKLAAKQKKADAIYQLLTSAEPHLSVLAGGPPNDSGAVDDAVKAATKDAKDSTK